MKHIALILAVSAMIVTLGCSATGDPNKALANAAVEGRPAAVRAALGSGADANHRFEGGQTPLMLACMRASSNEDVLEVVKALVDAGADVNLETHDGRTAMGWAANSTRLDLVMYLFDSGAEISMQTQKGWTPLMAASIRGEPSVVRYLLESGADPAVSDSTGRTARSIAEREGYNEIVELIDAALAEIEANTAG